MITSGSPNGPKNGQQDAGPIKVAIDHRKPEPASRRLGCRLSRRYTTIKFWRLTVNERHWQARDKRKRKREQRRREKGLRQTRLDKLAKMLGIVRSEHEGEVLSGAGRGEQQPVGDDS